MYVSTIGAEFSMVSTCAFSRLNIRSASSFGLSADCVVWAPPGEVCGFDHSAEAAEFAWSVPSICPEVSALIKTRHTNMLDIKALRCISTSSRWSALLKTCAASRLVNVHGGCQLFCRSFTGRCFQKVFEGSNV